jgi:hypothetical protein
MTDMRQRMRRTLPVIILDAALAVVAALHSGHLPWSGKVGKRRAAAIWMTAAGAAAVAGTITLVVGFLHSPGGLAPLGVASPPPPAAIEPPPSRPSPSPSTQPGVDGIGASPAVPRTPGPSTTPPVSGPPTTPPGTPAPLTARYAPTQGGQALLSYRATVTIANPGARPTAGWLLTITLPRPTLTITDVSGATVRQDDSTWTFTPDAGTAAVPAGGTMQISFQVRGATLVSAAPTACTIDGRPCDGVRSADQG